MAWSNIFLQIITPAGPIIGEGLLEGWQTSIELTSFKWGVKFAPDAKGDGGGLGGAAKALGSIVGVGRQRKMEMEPLTLEKRFDISSAMIHTCLDNHIPIISASITVLNIKHGGRVMHEPGFTLVAADGFITECDLSMSPTGNGVEVKETIKFKFKSIMITYLKTYGKDSIPTIPFGYVSAEKSALGF